MRIMEREAYRKTQEEHLRFSIDVVRVLKTSKLKISKYDNLHLLDAFSESFLTVTMTLCPLYEPGTLSESRLMGSPNTIEQSRVAEKWRVGIRVFKAITEACSRKGIGTKAALTFADVGVITKDPNEEDVSLLAYHERLYRDAAERDLYGELGMQYSFQRYSTICPDFPQFIPANSTRLDGIKMERGISSREVLRKKPSLMPEVTELMNRVSENRVVFDPSIYDPQTGSLQQRTIERIVSLICLLEGNIGVAEGLIRQYGTFDAHTTLKGALNVFVERESAALLLKLTDLFPHRTNPRIDMLC